MTRFSIPSRPRLLQAILPALLLSAAALFFALHATHLTADFPNHSPWMDWAKYTDEGWYGDGAIRYVQHGRWYVPGDFNPAAALPVWPFAEWLVFHFTGVSIAAARALAVGIFGLTLVASFLLLRRWQRTPSLLGPSTAVLLLAVSPFCYAFTRLAILEPLLIFLTLVTLLVASMRVEGSNPGRLLQILALGVLLPLMVLTKTTAVFLVPAIAWLLWASVGYRLRSFFRIALPSVGLAAVLWLSFYALFVRPHFLEDYRYLFAANGYTFITADTALEVLHDTVTDGLWMGKLLYPLSLVLLAASLVIFRRHIHPLLIALGLWAGGYAAFLAYHNNLQPRYYLVLAVPLTLLLPLAFEELYARAARLRPLIATAAIVLFAAIAIPDARQTLHYVRTPEYTFEHAAAQLHQIVASDHAQSPLILSISGSDLSLMTGLSSICDDFGTMELDQRIATYHPGWYAAWNVVEDDKMEALAPFYHLNRVAAFPVMDDPERNLLILYRLDPANVPPPPPGVRKPIPRLLRTKMGQQPSVSQLQH